MSDYCYQEIARWEQLNEIDIPIDEYGHYLDWNYIRDNMARDLTTPYGLLHFAVGGSDEDSDFETFFDYAELPDGRMILHSVINSESGCFISDGDYTIVNKDEATDIAMGMVDQALEALNINELYHDEEGWNQTPCYFWRSVESYINDDSKTPERRLS
jgi:hypothetical protein